MPSPDGKKLFIGVGSLTNIGDRGLKAEEGRAAVWELDLASGQSRIFASGLRNPVGLAWEPQTSMLWTVVNERDGLGDETPPDYLTSVQDGGLWMAVLLLGTDRRRSGCAGRRRRGEGGKARLRARRAHGVAGPLLAARWDASRFSRRHGDRATRLLEPQHAERI